MLGWIPQVDGDIEGRGLPREDRVLLLLERPSEGRGSRGRIRPGGGGSEGGTGDEPPIYATMGGLNPWIVGGIGRQFVGLFVRSWDCCQLLGLFRLWIVCHL